MELPLLVVSILILSPHALADHTPVATPQVAKPPHYPSGDVRNCPPHTPQNHTQPLFRMEVLPGAGFDNLRNLDMGQVHAYNYSNCKISNDGKYLLPDSTFLIPVQESQVEVFAEFFESWDNYTSMTASSINVDASFFSFVNGKFSTDYMSTKSHQVNDKAKTTRVQLRHKLYTVKLQPGAQLHPNFKSRLFDIAANLQNNNTEYAIYLAELLVRDYGTHFVTSMDAGALLAQVDHIFSSYSQSTQGSTTKITASASADFFGKVNLETSFSYQSSETDVNGFRSNRASSKVFTIGGPPFRPNFTVTDWENGVPDALVAIDRSGDPLHFAITPVTLPELPEITVQEVAKTVYKAINRYYKVNTRPGCMNVNAKNFNYQANLDDHTCEPTNTNFTFGGIFQTCQVDPKLNTEDLCNSGPDPAAQLNPLTGDFACPNGYTAVLLHSGTVTHVTQKPVCNNVCHSCGWFGWSHCCQCQSVLRPFLSAAHYKAYWCVATPGEEIPQNSGYLFGGFYTSTASNPVTGSMTCPRYFIPLHFGEDVKVCVSSDYELGYADSIPFAGFESCIAGNPLAASSFQTSESPNSWPHACPHGYAQHLVTVDEGCEINFCVQMGAFTNKKLLPARLPPFRKHPKHKMNVTEALVVFGIYGKVWVRDADGRWEIDNSDVAVQDGRSLLQFMTSGTTANTSNTGGSLSSGSVAVISIVATVVFGAMIAAVVFVGRRFWRSKQKKRDGYETLSGQIQQQRQSETEGSHAVNIDTSA